jgi:hypothetical protein
MENVMKRVSLVGLVLGVIVGLVAGLLAGSWIFWLGMGLAIGILVGSVSTRRHLLEGAGIRGELKP